MKQHHLGTIMTLKDKEISSYVSQCGPYLSNNGKEYINVHAPRNDYITAYHAADCEYLSAWSSALVPTQDVEQWMWWSQEGYLDRRAIIQHSYFFLTFLRKNQLCFKMKQASKVGTHWSDTHSTQSAWNSPVPWYQNDSQFKRALCCFVTMSDGACKSPSFLCWDFKTQHSVFVYWNINAELRDAFRFYLYCILK